MRNGLAATCCLLAFAGVAAVATWRSRSPCPAAAAPRTGASPPVVFGGSARGSGGGAFSGVGWSVERDTTGAVRHAMAAARGASPQVADLAIVYYTTDRNPREVLRAVASGPMAPRRLIGMTSYEGVLTADGFHGGADGVVGLLALSMPGVRVGVGSARLAEGPPRRIAQLAYRRAVEDASAEGDVSGRPAMVLLYLTIGHEEEMLAGIEEEAGGPLPLIGGSAAGTKKLVARQDRSPWSIIAGGEVIENGLAVAVLYSAEPFGFAYRGGFDRTSKSGVVTDADPRLIRAIDGRPAADVFDEWLGGRLYEAVAGGVEINGFTGLYPLTRILGSADRAHHQYVHAWPSSRPGEKRFLLTAADVRVGDVLYFCEGNWNVLLNRFAAMPRLAAENAPGIETLAAMVIICACVAENIPDEYKAHMAHLMNNALGGVPWMGALTWGEQGFVPGFGLLQGNLTTSAVLFPDVRRKD